MFNLSTLSGINLQTDNYFQYTSVPTQTPKSFRQNALTFYIKRKCVFFSACFLPSVPQVYPHKKGPPKCNFEKALYRSEEKSYSSL